MAFPTSVLAAQAYGVVGELAFDGPKRAKAFNLVSTDAAYNVFGRAFTITSEGIAQAGSGGARGFGGILISPKEHASFGTAAGGPFAPVNVLPNNTVAQLLSMGEVWVQLDAAANVGDRVVYDNTTGVLSPLGGTSEFTGAISTTTLTVTNFVTGDTPLAVGTVVTATGVTPGTTITALGTGTGGNGTYTVNNSQTVAATNMVGTNPAPANKTVIPNARIETFDTTGNPNIAVLKLTN